MYFGYMFRNRNTEAPPPPPPPVQPSGNDIIDTSGGTQGIGALSPLLDEPIMGYAAKDNLLVVTMRGEIQERRGTAWTPASSSTISSLFSVETSFDKRFVLVGIGERNNPLYKVFDSLKREWRFVPRGALGAIWSPSTREIVYAEERASGPVLLTLNIEASSAKPKLISAIPFRDTVLAWPEYGRVVFSGRSSALLPNLFFSLDITKRAVTPIVLEKSGAVLLWSPSGKFALAFTGGGKGGSLLLINRLGESLREFNFLTLPEKCAFKNDDLLLCAIPKNESAFRNAQLPDAYYKRALFTEDELFSVNLKTGAVGSIFNAGVFDASRLQIYNDQLYFINRLDRRLYSVPFKG